MSSRLQLSDNFIPSTAMTAILTSRFRIGNELRWKACERTDVVVMFTWRQLPCFDGAEGKWCIRKEFEVSFEFNRLNFTILNNELRTFLKFWIFLSFLIKNFKFLVIQFALKSPLLFPSISSFLPTHFRLMNPSTILPTTSYTSHFASIFQFVIFLLFSFELSVKETQNWIEEK